MAYWRLITASTLTALLGAPLLAPLLELLAHPSGWRSWGDVERLADLAGHTVLFAGGVVALAVPAGAVLAVLLERSDLPGRQALRGLTVIAIFVPLPLLATAWQAILGPSSPGPN